MEETEKNCKYSYINLCPGLIQYCLRHLIIISWWLKEYILCLIIIIKSEVWTITHCLGLGHETMVCTVCLSIFLCIMSVFRVFQSLWNSAVASAAFLLRHLPNLKVIHAFSHSQRLATEKMTMLLGGLAVYTCMCEGALLLFQLLLLQLCAIITGSRLKYGVLLPTTLHEAGRKSRV